MFNHPVHRQIEILGQVIDDLKRCEAEIQTTNDPALIFEYEEERNALADELDYVARNCTKVLEAYMEDCKINNIPVYLDYQRVLKELRLSEQNDTRPLSS
jgi:hypothetical protein